MDNITTVSNNLATMYSDLSTAKVATSGVGQTGTPNTEDINNPGLQRGVTKVGGGPASNGPSGVILTPGNQSLYIDDPIKAAETFSTLEKNNSTTTTSTTQEVDPYNPCEVTTNTSATTTGMLGGTKTTDTTTTGAAGMTEPVITTTTTTLTSPKGNITISSEEGSGEVTATITAPRGNATISSQGNGEATINVDYQSITV